MSEIKLDVKGEVCPVPLVETRKALNKASPGDIIEVTGTNIPSKSELEILVEALGMELLDETGKDGIWTIRIRKVGV